MLCQILGLVFRAASNSASVSDDEERGEKVEAEVVVEEEEKEAGEGLLFPTAALKMAAGEQPGALR